MKLISNGFEVRFRYDGTKFQPSNISTNEITDDSTLYFKFEDEFANYLDLFTIDYEEEENVVNAIVSFFPPVEETDHIINDPEDGMQVSTQGGVLLGKMSFQMTAEEFDISGFSLVEATNSPVTGIKINLNIKEAFTNQSTFRFKDATASKDATLSNLIVSSGVVDDENPDNSTYKEYQLTPSFDKDTNNYEIELLEYIDTINVKPKLSDANATMQLKVPKRDDDNNLVYDTDGTTIIYEVISIQDDTQNEVTLNKLGEPDTVITVMITAEDGRTTNEYEVVIKRPYGTIKGTVQLGDNLRESMENLGVYTEYIVDANVYKSDIFNWEGIIPGDSTYDELDLLPKEITVVTDKDTGAYEIKIIPGTYDLQLERRGFLNHIVKSITVNNGDEIDLGNKILFPGDVDRNGMVSLQDFTTILNRMDATEGDEIYLPECDFGQKGYIALIDMTTVLNFMDNLLIIENY